MSGNPLRAQLAAIVTGVVPRARTPRRPGWVALRPDVGTPDRTEARELRA